MRKSQMLRTGLESTGLSVQKLGKKGVFGGVWAKPKLSDFV